MSSKTEPRNWRLFLLFCAFRVSNVFLIQSQFDPDEYWQQLEPAYCHVFVEAGRECPSLTWEWTRKGKNTDYSSIVEFLGIGKQGPVRSYASIMPTLCFYYLAKYLGLDSPWMIARGPVFLNAIITAAPADWSIWYLSRWMSPAAAKSPAGRWNYIFCSLTSWFWAYALVRTYSNSLETVLLALSLCLIAPELLSEDKVHAPHRVARACFAFFLGGLSCSIRFTSLAAYIPMGIMLCMSSSSMISCINHLISICFTYGLLGIIVVLALDLYMFGFAVFPILANIQFNVIEGNGRLYGTHPLHWYITAGVPAISGILLPFLALSFSRVRSWRRSQRNLWSICICYIIAHSFSEHKEFRFLLPVLPLFCLLSGEHVGSFMQSSPAKRKKLLGLLAGTNFLVVLYLGLFHQRGSIQVNRRVLELAKHEPQKYTIHYLMGCHSTPLLSHLHSPPVTFEPWTLDCGPTCRADPKLECESERFLRDPGKFVEDTYFHCLDLEEGTCITDLRILYPDFLITSASDMSSMRSRIEAMGLKEVGRFLNGIKRIQVGNFGGMHDAGGATIKPFLGGAVTLEFDEIILFENNQVKPRY